MKKLPISAIVVTYNEGHLLEKCLKSIQFCEEIVVVDLKSTDNSKAIAEKWATRILSHSPVPVVEIIHQKICPSLKNEWVLLTDPDEVTDSSLIKDIATFLNKKKHFAKCSIPMQYYFKNKPLKGTIWGGIKESRFLVNKKFVNFTDNVHQGIDCKENVAFFTIPFKEKNVVHHYWMQNFSTLFEKHLRYLEKEGQAKYENGKKYSLKIQIKQSIYAFKDCFYNHKGYLDGLTGLFLSFFWVWYVYKSWDSLKHYEKTIHLEK